MVFQAGRAPPAGGQNHRVTEDAAYTAAVVLAAVLLLAAAAKLARPQDAARSFRGLGLPFPAPLARAVPAAELAVAALLLAAPRAGAVGTLALLTAFSAVLGRAVRAGVATPCACFGAVTSDPVSAVEIVRNGLLALLAAAALGATRPRLPDPVAAVAVAASVAAGWRGLAALRRRNRRG